ncbi:hypothetical protein Ancab_007978 [Ancistrocladus abbreviatus]
MDKEVKGGMMEQNSAVRHAKTYAEAVTQTQRSEKQQNSITENRNRVSPTTDDKEVMELETENGTEDETEKLGVAAQSPYQHTATPANSHPSPVDQQSTGHRSDQLSSRWSPRVGSDGPNLEIYDRHKSPAARRYIGNEARAKERDKGENNVRALMAGQQSGDGDLHGGQRLRDEWEIPISSLRRKKGRPKKNKRVPEVHTVVSVED